MYVFLPFLGYYQALEGQATCDDCPLGTYCDPYELGNVTGIVSPVPCPAGYFCPLRTEFATQNPCAPGTFGNVTHLTAQGKVTLSEGNAFMEKWCLFEFT